MAPTIIYASGKTGKYIVEDESGNFLPRGWWVVLGAYKGPYPTEAQARRAACSVACLFDAKPCADQSAPGQLVQ